MAIKNANVYNLGEEGVNVDSDDVHLRDGELRSAQNLQIDSAGGLGGVRRRDALLELNSSAMAGSVTGIIGIPLPDRSQLSKYFYAAGESASSTVRWRKSSDAGANWADSTDGEIPASTADLGAAGTAFNFSGALRWQGFNNRLWYPASDYTLGTTRPTIHVWNGTLDFKFAEIPNNPSSNDIPRGITSIVPYNPTNLLVGVVDDEGTLGRGRVLLMNITNGTFTELGPDTDLNGGVPFNFCLFDGRIWAGFVNLAGGSATTVRWVRPGDTTWTTDSTLTLPATMGYVVDIIPFKGKLYIATAIDVGDQPEIRERDQEGTWTIRHTGTGGTDALDYMGPFVVTQDGSTILAGEMCADGPQRILESTDGVTWSEVYDIRTELGTAYTNYGMPIVDRDDGSIFWPIMTAGAADAILKRTTGGTWSISHTIAMAKDLRGPIAIIKF